MHQEQSSCHERQVVPSETGFKRQEWPLCLDQTGLLFYFLMFDWYIAASTSAAAILNFLHSTYNRIFFIFIMYIKIKIYSIDTCGNYI
jgi:hypothetical protein